MSVLYENFLLVIPSRNKSRIPQDTFGSKALFVCAAVQLLESELRSAP